MYIFCHHACIFSWISSIIYKILDAIKKINDTNEWIKTVDLSEINTFNSSFFLHSPCCLFFL